MVLEEAEEDDDVPVTVDDADEEDQEDQVDDLLTYDGVGLAC